MSREVLLTVSTSSGYYDEGIEDDDIFLTEISCMEIEDRHPTGRRLHLYVKPPVDLSPSASEESGLTDEFLVDKPIFAEISGDIINFIGSASIVVYSTKFERKHFIKEFNRIGFKGLNRRKFVDVQSLAGKITNTSTSKRYVENFLEKFNLPKMEDRSSFQFLDSILAIYAKLAEIELASNPPSPPEQGVGPKFQLDTNGLIDLAGPDDFDSAGNNVRILKSLYPALREIVSELVERLSSGNIPYAGLQDKIRKYRDLLSEDLTEVNFALLFGAGVRFENSIISTKKEIEHGELPRLDVGLEEALTSLVQLHSAFILSTVDGLNLVAAEERYTRTPFEENEVQRAILDISKKFLLSPDIIHSEAASFISISAEEAQGFDATLRNKLFADSVAVNVVVVMLAGASIAAIPIVGNVVLGAVGTWSGGVIAFFGAEGLKKSKSFIATSKIIAENIDSISDIEVKKILERRSSQLRPLLNFVLNNENGIRKISGEPNKNSKLHRMLDWLLLLKQKL